MAGLVDARPVKTLVILTASIDSEVKNLVDRYSKHTNVPRNELVEILLSEAIALDKKFVSQAAGIEVASRAAKKPRKKDSQAA